ncbi:uncharacterized protein LOC109714130 isoform X2 [Ananas comosus]|uniref:Uncharacterized protein LOC109714130 isoform X2 n=1 Tax=Ananas comosus TaxID=4615 RepID=A0A6P5FEX4_ANACO|nr:uncharacterized protein LOC109714130 isoform X2 [Ananas comosus]
MDCDDNDFQSQNFQLIGEDSNKSPPSLRPFAVPKFDIDEQLQVHLRFDNLVETEVLFGIQGQGNNWIEDFSPVSSAIEFSPSAAESCSLSRTNNVWSEATSSESVEMLLRSVGDDDMAHNKDGTKDGDAHDRLNGIDCHMDPSCRRDVALSQPQVKDISQTPLDEKSGYELGESLLREKSNSDMNSIAEKGTVDDKLASSSNDTSRSCLVVDEYFEVFEDENPLEDTLKGKTEGNNSDPSPLSVDNQLFSEQVMKLQEIHRTFADNLHPNRKQEAKSQVASFDGEGNQHSESHTVEADLCNMKSLGSIELLQKGTNESLLSGSSDGLLESIAYPVKTLSKDNVTHTETGLHAVEISSLDVEADVTMSKHSVVDGCANISKHSDIREQHEDIGHYQPNYHSRDPVSHTEDPLSTRDAGVIKTGEESELNSNREVSGEKQDSRGQVASGGEDAISKPGVTVQSPIEVDLRKHETETEREDVNDFPADPMTLTCQNAVVAVSMKSTEDEDAKETIDKTEITFDASENVIRKETSPSLPDDLELNDLSSSNKKSVETSDISNLVTESKDGHLSTHISTTGEKDAELPVSLGPRTSQSESSTVMEEMKCLSEAQSTKTVTVMNSSSPSNLIQDNSGVVSDKLDSSRPSLNNLTAPPQTYSDDTPMTVVVEQEVERSSLSVSGCIESCDKNAEVAVTSTYLKSSLNTQPSGDVVDSPSSAEPFCGSPTVISSSKPSQDERGEGSKELSQCTYPALDNPVQISETGQRSKPESPTSKDDKSFSFEVGLVPDADAKDNNTGNELKPFPSIKSSETTVVSKKNSEGHHLHPEVGSLPKNNSEKSGGDKSKRASGRSSKRMSSSTVAAKETSQRKQMIESNKSPLSALPIAEFTGNTKHSKEKQQHPTTESSRIKASSSPVGETSSLPDLNTSISSAALTHQPFTDSQQVQLRAQIFVYGSLIQGVPPDEACMISAFGESGGGRTKWEGLWHAAVERYQNQKSPLSTSETPIGSRQGARIAEQASTRDGAGKSKSLKSASSRGVSKAMPSPILFPPVSLPSPSWAMPLRDNLQSSVPRGTHLDFGLSPLHSYPSSQMRQYAGNAGPWFSHTPRPTSWVLSSQSSIFETASLAVPAAETAKVTPPKDSSISPAPTVQLVSPSTLLSNPVSASVSAASVVQVETPKKAAISSSKSAASTQKPRKRKKGVITEEQELISGDRQVQTEPASAALASNQSSSSPGLILSPSGAPQVRTGPASAALASNQSSSSPALILSPSHPSKVVSGGLVLTTSQITSSNYPIIGGGGTEQRPHIFEEIFNRIEQSKKQAQEAAAHAAAAVRHSQGIWSHLATQKNSGLVAEAEEKLASAAVAAAAAASVAKAAAEAAKVASEAALQAKMMADEAITTVTPQILETGQLDVGKNLAMVTPGSILKGKSTAPGSCSIISAAREVARKRVEAASAARKRMENLDAVLKAAELAAEAVSQAGVIIAMGDPLPLTITELVESGPEAYWKAHPSVIEKPSNILQLQETSGAKPANEQPSNQEEVKKFAGEGLLSANKESLRLEENQTDILANIPLNRSGEDSSLGSLKGNSIRKGSLVEVAVDDDGLRGVWCSGSVLDIKDDRAYVCYNDRLPDDGSGQLKEWIPLMDDSDKPPRIRVAHPMTTTKFEGTRKRRRELENYAWAIGDRVDAWIRDGWWEGTITEKSQADETEFTVHFPAGNSLVVKAWNLRPSLVWKDGHWIEQSRVRDKNTKPYEGDSPYEKRQRLGQLESESHLDNSKKPEEFGHFNVSEKDRIFTMGKNVRKEDSTGALGVKRTGLQKEGSRVVFGVPRPGKKRKFMEVSKHYVADKADKTDEANNPIKFAKYLMPQTSRGWGASKVDPKGKRSSEPKPRVVKSVKSQNSQGRISGEKENLSVTTMSASNVGDSAFGSSFSNQGSNLEKKSALDLGSSRNSAKTTDGSLVDSNVEPSVGHPASKKKPSTPSEPEIGGGGKLTSAVETSTVNEHKAFENFGRTNLDAIQPRRSNRRIQPTSRLLEGLQSSLIISKIPSVTHDKGARGQHRGSTFG